ncbi:hypothetical protein [Roseimicrobium sp. ORNL1]|uniref:hypothetical protein n=1 Tax=Roseimicrobium sp. ORNL1 TaxID=2711231 RepID=UPI0013E1AEBE|nr:hypothetical protein [Roseimicrobium sp. ORNL1]QIF02942.1 hypothetical protein G5S37_15910 [Roseimicrobium sp. ORNL1]
MSSIGGFWKKRGLPLSVEGVRSCKASYSQFGEDAVLAALIHAEQTEGHYLDLGCYAPIRWSNTYHFYQRGWSGVTVDANSKHAADWKRMRPRDRHMTAAVLQEEGCGTAILDEDPVHDAMNRVSVAQPAEGKAKRTVPVLGIDCLPKWWPYAQAPHLVSTDLEGFDKEIALVYPFETHAPEVYVAEFGYDSLEPEVEAVFLKHGYKLFARLGPSWIWQRA